MSSALSRRRARPAPSLALLPRWSGSPAAIGAPGISWGGSSAPASQGNAASTTLVVTEPDNVTRKVYPCSAGIARVDRRIVSGREVIGWLIERATTQRYYPSSGNFPSAINVTFAAGDASGYNPAVNFVKMIETAAANAYHGANAAYPGGFVTQQLKVCVSVLLKAPATGGRRYVAVCVEDAATGGQNYVVLDLQTGSLSDWVNPANMGVGDLRTVETVAPGEYLVRISMVPGNSPNNIKGFQLALTTSATSLNASWTGDPVTYPNGIQYALGQFEVGDYPTQHITSTSGTVAQAADSAITFPVAGRVGVASGAIMFGFHSPTFTPSLTRTLLSIDDGSAANRYEVYIDSAGLLNLAVRRSGSADGDAQRAVSVLDNAYHLVLVAWGEGTVRFWVDGVLVSTLSVTLPSAQTTLRLGSNNAGAQQPGPVIVSSPRAFQRHVTWREALASSGYSAGRAA